MMDSILTMMESKRNTVFSDRFACVFRALREVGGDYAALAAWFQHQSDAMKSK